MSEHTDVQAALSKATIKLMRRGGYVFLSTLVLALDFKIDEKVPTACTNGLDIKFNPDFVRGLSKDEIVFLIAHEAWHVAFMHMCRLQGRDPKKWNYAADYAINGMLKKEGFTLIKGVLYEPKYDGMSAEQIYDLLPDDYDDQPNPQDGDFEPDAGLGSGEGNGDGSGKSTIERKVEDAVIKAAEAAKMSNEAGNIPGEIAKAIHDILNPQLPWQQILLQYMSAKAKNEKSWSRRNKRFKSVYLPSKLSQSMGDVNIYVDASGSVSDDEFSAYIGEMEEIRTSLKPQTMKVISFDTNIKEEFVMEKGEDLEVSFSGGGGTSLQCVVEHAEKQAEKPDITIVFTDGYFSDQDYSRFGTDVIWVIVNNKSWTCDIGRVIHMEYKP